MKVHWQVEDQDKLGNQLGFAVHNREARLAVEAEGVEVTPDADLSVTCASPCHFHPPDDGKVHGMYTAWDTTTLPESADSLANADFIVSTATYLEPVFRTKMREDAPLYVCPLGVHADRFAKKGRRSLHKDERMLALWIGAPNIRKGYPFILDAAQGMSEHPIDFYMKTTAYEHEGPDVQIKKMGKRARVIIDYRKVPLDDLVKLYHRAHVFLLPTMGEGFGLSLAEAMAAGLPCIYTPWSGVTDYCDSSVAFPIDFELRRMPVTPNIPKTHPQYDSYCCVADMAYPSAESICNRLQWIFGNYKRAQAKGQRAAARMKARFTWAHTGRRLKEIFEEVEKRCLPV